MDMNPAHNSPDDRTGDHSYGRTEDPMEDRTDRRIAPDKHVVDVAFAAAAYAGTPLDSTHEANLVVTAAVQTLVLESDAVREFLNRIAHYVADRLTTTNLAVLCGVTIVRARTNLTVASSSHLAQAMDEAQNFFGDGPCLDAARHQRTNHVPDMNDESARWPKYRAVIAHHGLHSMVSVPILLDADGASSCAINVYAETTNAFSRDDIETAEGLAREIADAVRIAVRLAYLTATHLTTAMGSRTAVDLATGILMAQDGCSQETALTILKAASSARDLSLQNLAAGVILSLSTDRTITHFDQ